MDVLPSCPRCGSFVKEDFNFCPKCGLTLKALPFTISIGKEIGIYLLSFFVPPFGLVPAFKYVRQSNPKAKQIGIVAIILTVVSLGLTFWLAFQTMTTYMKLLNSISSGELGI